MPALTILIYHQVLEHPDPFRPGETAADVFDMHMRVLSRYFKPLPLSAAIGALENGTLPRRAVCVTFDDGYADNYRVALPVLKRWSVPATFFVATGFLDGGRMWNDTVIEAMRRVPGPDFDLSDLGLGRYCLSDDSTRVRSAVDLIQKLKYLPLAERQEKVEVIEERAGQQLPVDLMMTSAQLRKLAGEEGMEIGGHTVSHPILARLDRQEAYSEIESGKKELEALVQRQVSLFAYPNGKPGQDYTERDIDIVREIGFEAAVSTTYGVTRNGGDRYQLPRIGPWDTRPWRFGLRILRDRLGRG